MKRGKRSRRIVPHRELVTKCDRCHGPLVPEQCSYMLCHHVLCSACSFLHDSTCEWQRAAADPFALPGGAS